jgi:hypothetical protein
MLGRLLVRRLEHKCFKTAANAGVLYFIRTFFTVIPNPAFWVRNLLLCREQLIQWSRFRHFSPCYLSRTFSKTILLRIVGSWDNHSELSANALSSPPTSLNENIGDTPTVFKLSSVGDLERNNAQYEFPEPIH